MFDFLERLKERPEHERHALALGFSVGVTALIFFIWASTFFSSIGADAVVITREDIESVKNADQASAVSLSPFDSLKDSLSGLKNSFGEIRSMIDKVNSLEYKSE